MAFDFLRDDFAACRPPAGSDNAAHLIASGDFRETDFWRCAATGLGLVMLAMVCIMNG
jgi:hypothetical protein